MVRVYSYYFRFALFFMRSILLGLIAFLVVAWGGNTIRTQPTANPTVVRVNGFGTAANHVHSLLVLPSHMLIHATHYGLFRSQDGGVSWREIAWSSNQPIDG